MNFHALLTQYKLAQPLRKATCHYPINLKIDTTYTPAILLETLILTYTVLKYAQECSQQQFVTGQIKKQSCICQLGNHIIKYLTTRKMN